MYIILLPADSITINSYITKPILNLKDLAD